MITMIRPITICSSQNFLGTSSCHLLIMHRNRSSWMRYENITYAIWYLSFIVYENNESAISKFWTFRNTNWKSANLAFYQARLMNSKRAHTYTDCIAGSATDQISRMTPENPAGFVRYGPNTIEGRWDYRFWTHQGQFEKMAIIDTEWHHTIRS